MAVAEPGSYPIDITWDTGAVDHVASQADLPNYAVEESEGSKAGRRFVTASGKEILQEGQVKAQMADQSCKQRLGSIFQVTAVNRPLWSISKVLDDQADPNCEVVFERDGAVARDSKGRVFAKAVRQGGLYVARLDLQNPKAQGFVRQG